MARRDLLRPNSPCPAIDVELFLQAVGLHNKPIRFAAKETILTQGDPAANVLYIQEGGAKVAVVNEAGKEAVITLLGPGEFFGEGCLAGQSQYPASVSTIAPTSVLVIEKGGLARALREDQVFSDRFVAYLLARNIRSEADLINHRFNSSEQRLARTLLLLARYGSPGRPQQVLPRVSQEVLAEMVGTTRSRVNVFMNRFKKLGHIQYQGSAHASVIRVSKTLLSVVLQD